MSISALTVSALTDVAAKKGDEFLHIYRLGEDLVEIRIPIPDTGQMPSVEGCEKKHRKVGVKAADFMRRLLAGVGILREHQVEQNHIRLLALEELKAVLHRIGGEDRIARVLEQGAFGLEYVLIVIDDEDFTLMLLCHTFAS